MKKSQLVDLGILILRVGLAVPMLAHGLSKAEMLFGGEGASFADPIGIGSMFSLILVTFAELVCAALVLIGFKTRLAAIPIVITMFVVIFFVYGDQAWKAKELEVIYMVSFGALMFIGSGNYSIDKLLGKK